MASARAILLAKAVWVAVKDAEVAKKVRIASMMAKKLRGNIEIDCMGGHDVLDPAKSKGTRGTGGVKEAGSRTVTDGAAKTGI